MGRQQVDTDRILPENHIRVWLVDSDDEADNQHVDFELKEAADLVARPRAEGRVVLLHCVQAHSRTPSVGALYAALQKGVPAAEAVGQVVDSLLMAYPNHALRAAIERVVAKEAAPDRSLHAGAHESAADTSGEEQCMNARVVGLNDEDTTRRYTSMGASTPPRSYRTSSSTLRLDYPATSKRSSLRISRDWTGLLS